MWFKNIQIFHFETPMGYDPEKLENDLSDLTFQPCAKTLPQSFGWAPPLGDEDASLVYASNGFMMFRMKVEEKLLPPSVIREQHLEKIQELEEKFERKLYRDEKLRLKDEMYHTLLAKAFSRTADVYAYVDTKRNTLIVDTSSSKRIEQFLSLYSKTVLDHAIFTPETKSPSTLMTSWLSHQKYPASLSITNNCTLQNSNDERSTARFTHADLTSDAVTKALEDGFQVVQLGLNWREQVMFNLKHDFSISGVKFLEGVQEVAKNCHSETVEERFAADFIIMAETLQNFLGDFMEIFKQTKKEEAIMA